MHYFMKHSPTITYFIYYLQVIAKFFTYNFINWSNTTMASHILNLTVIIFILYSIIDLSLESVYRYDKATAQTLLKLDLNTIEGKWYCLYERKPKDHIGSCSQLNIIANQTYVTVTQSNKNKEIFEFELQQNKYLEGKLSRVEYAPEGYALERPWFVSQAQPLLVVYQVMSANSSEDNWSVYGRDEIVRQEVIDSGVQKLIAAGASADENGQIGYYCSHTSQHNSITNYLFYGPNSAIKFFYFLQLVYFFLFK